MASANQTPGGYKFAPLVASQQGRANQHEPACFGLSSPWSFPLRSGIRLHICMYVCMVIPYSRGWSCSWSAEQGKWTFPCLRACLRIWSRETGSAVPSRVSLFISILRLNLVLTYGIPHEFRGGVHLFIYNRHTPSGQSRVYRVTQLRTDGIHCRKSAGTGPVNLKVLSNGCCLGRSPWTN